MDTDDMKLKIDETPCIAHGAAETTYGYCRIRKNGKMQYLHRLIYCEAQGLDISDIAGQVIRHTCDNPRCINPEHLILGSQNDNCQDIAKRRRHGLLKLTPQQVVEIRRDCNPNSFKDATPNPFGYRALAIKFGVRPQAIRNVYLGLTHKYTS